VTFEEKKPSDFDVAKDEFVAQWGALSSSWGISRTMAQIHALLLVSPEAMCTDQIMEDLQISRGNAHGNLKELVAWGIVRSSVRKGDRKEYFEAEKDIWKMFCIIARERKRREIEPAGNALKHCAQLTADADCDACREFSRQMEQLSEFVDLFSSLLDKLSDSEESRAIPAALKFLS
jgi:DNA-binding transcriptional regulator GbsR (MarR family)